jgi:hypothetical protein
MQLNGWDRALKVTADGKGLVGHAGAVLLRKAADQLGLTAGLSAALRRKGSSPLLDRGTVLVSLAAAIALGATSMSDIALLAHLAPVLGQAPSGPTVRRALELAGSPRTLDRVARARAKAREHAWSLIEKTPAGFPWLAVAGKSLAGWLVIDMDATLVTARSDKEGAAPTWKKGYGFHPLAAWCANTRECLNMLLRPGNAGSDTFADHQEVLSATLPRTRSATGSGIFQPGWPGTPGSEPSPSAPTGPGRRPSSPAGSGSAPCRPAPDRQKPPLNPGRRTTRRGRSRRPPGRTGGARPPPAPRTNRHEVEKQTPA